MQDGPKAIWSIPYISEAFFPSFKQNFIAYSSSTVSLRQDCIFASHQLWQSGFSRVYSNCCCSCWFKPEIIKIGQSSHKTYSNNILNFQESTTILNASTKKSGNLLKAPHTSFQVSQKDDFTEVIPIFYVLFLFTFLNQISIYLSSNVIHKRLNFLRSRRFPRGWVVESWIGVSVSQVSIPTSGILPV